MCVYLYICDARVLLDITVEESSPGFTDEVSALKDNEILFNHKKNLYICLVSSAKGNVLQGVRRDVCKS